jgi:hypothetical protein
VRHGDSRHGDAGGLVAQSAERRAIAEVALQSLAHAVQAEAFASRAAHGRAIPRPDRCSHFERHLIRGRPHDHVDAAGAARLRHAVLDRSSRAASAAASTGTERLGDGDPNRSCR